MADLEMLDRRLREQRMHNEALAEAYRKSQNENIMLAAQVKSITESAKLRLTQCADLIDSLNERIESMVNEWQGQIREQFKDDEKERNRRLAMVEPFRPLRIGRVEVSGENSQPEKTQETQKARDESGNQKP